LGLAISQRLAQVLGGRIDFQSQLGVGSTFSLSIEVAEIEGMQLIHYQTPEARWAGRGQPIGAAAVNPTLAHPDRGIGSGRLNVRVLIVDDRRDIRFLTQHFVRQVGGEVLLAENGKEALAIVEQERAAARPLDIILMDVQMPEMDGLTATRHLRSEHYAGPIIALTANAMDSDRQACLDAGYTDYLSKPIDATQLIDMLRKYAKSSTRMVSD
jgi:CheY-like chemotaxis protein